ncbi:MAG: metal-dependent hydrolase [Candidatus Hodarchaeota archaeon]
MYLLFHIALPLILMEIPRIKQLRINKLSLIIGSILPDVIDKPLIFFGLGNGRNISHNLFFIILSFLILHFSIKRKTSISFPFLIGLIFHIILDLPEVPLFYPFIPYEFPYIDNPILFWFNKLWTDPLVFITEFIGLFFIVFIIINNKLYHTKDIRNYLEGIYQPSIQNSNEKEIDI